MTLTPFLSVTLTSAPFFSSCSTTCVCPAIHAIISSVHYIIIIIIMIIMILMTMSLTLLLSMTFTLAPCFCSNSAISVCPFIQAIPSGVR